MISAIIAFLNAIPILDKWFQELSKNYMAFKIEQNDLNFLNAMQALSKTKDQRALEEYLGSKTAGEAPNNMEGVEERKVEPPK